MKIVIVRSLVIVFITFLSITSVWAAMLEGALGSASGNNWQSSWLDLKPPIDFSGGDTLKIRVNGDAENVLVRLLPASSSPSSSDGIEGNVRNVPSNGVLEVTLEHDRREVKQISVHAGREAWGIPLGGNNGTIKVISVERIGP
jgi:hypothetical protein